MNFQKELIDFANGVCLLDCYLEMANVHAFTDKLEIINEAIKKNLVGLDGYVNDANRLYDEIINKKVKVSKSYSFDEDRPVIACYNNKHFVIINGKTKELIYDPLGESKSFKTGNITSYRLVEDKI